MNKAAAFLYCCLIAVAAPSRAQALDDALTQRVQALATQAAAQAAPQWQVEVRVGQLDPRLKLAPCTDVQPYLPTGVKLWGRTRIGLRCGDPGVRWNVFLPITIDVHGSALVATSALPAGTVLGPNDVALGPVNLSADPSVALADADIVLGRALSRPLAAGEALRQRDLRARQWFAAGDTVRIVAGGAGWRVHGEGQALNAGLEGQPVKVRTESGRVISGLAAGDRTVEVPL